MHVLPHADQVSMKAVQPFSDDSNVCTSVLPRMLLNTCALARTLALVLTRTVVRAGHHRPARLLPSCLVVTCDRCGISRG